METDINNQSNGDGSDDEDNEEGNLKLQKSKTMTTSQANWDEKHKEKMSWNQQKRNQRRIEKE